MIKYLLLIQKIKSKIYAYISIYILRKKATLFSRHINYQEYINKQKSKTLDKQRIEIWQNEEWDLKFNGFKEIFLRNIEYIKSTNKAICLGSRTGQEVAALRSLNKEAIGIDLIEFPPFTLQGDIHDLSFNDQEFDFCFTNIIDHALYVEKFISEMERVTRTDGYILLNLQLQIVGDDYSENIIFDPNFIINLFKKCKLITSIPIKNNFDNMNWEILLRKTI